MREKPFQEKYWEANVDWFVRNDVDPNSRRPLFKQILSKTFGVLKVCELGCGQGYNLRAIGSLSNNYELVGVELNKTALKVLEDFPRIRAIESSIQELELDESFDLVFVCGVLIHIDSELPLVYEKIDRLSRRYVLFCEYFNPVPVDVNYHEKGLLIKRDFAREFLVHTKGSYSPVDYGFVWKMQDPAWDNINWTLMEKAF